MKVFDIHSGHPVTCQVELVRENPWIFYPSPIQPSRNLKKKTRNRRQNNSTSLCVDCASTYTINESLMTKNSSQPWSIHPVAKSWPDFHVIRDNSNHYKFTLSTPVRKFIKWSFGAICIFTGLLNKGVNYLQKVWYVFWRETNFWVLKAYLMVVIIVLHKVKLQKEDVDGLRYKTRLFSNQERLSDDKSWSDRLELRR